MKLKANSTLKALAILPFLASPLLASNDLKQAQDALSTGDYKAAIQYASPFGKHIRWMPLCSRLGPR